MSTTSEMKERETRTEAAERRSRTVFSAAVAHEGAIVLNEAFATAHERRDAVVEHLRVNHDEVESETVALVLDRFGGASPDTAAEAVFALYEESVMGQLSLSLGESELDDGPAVLYGTLTDYGDGTIAAEAQGSAEERLDALRDRAGQFYEDLSGEELPENTDETFLVHVMNTLFLDPTKGRAQLFEMRRRDEGNNWRSEIS